MRVTNPVPRASDMSAQVDPRHTRCGPPAVPTGQREPRVPPRGCTTAPCPATGESKNPSNWRGFHVCPRGDLNPSDARWHSRQYLVWSAIPGNSYLPLPPVTSEVCPLGVHRSSVRVVQRSRRPTAPWRAGYTGAPHRPGRPARRRRRSKRASSKSFQRHTQHHRSDVTESCSSPKASWPALRFR